MKKAYLTFFKGLAFIEDFLSGACLIFSTFSTICQIVNRYWLHYEITWIGDFTLYVFVSGVIVTIAMTTREDAHTSVDVLVSNLFSGEISSKVFKIVINLCSVGIILLPLPIFYRYFLRALQFDEWGTLCPWFNTSWLVEGIFVMFLLCIFHILHNTGVLILQLCRRNAEGNTGREAEAV